MTWTAGILAGSFAGAQQAQQRSAVARAKEERSGPSRAADQYEPGDAREASIDPVEQSQPEGQSHHVRIDPRPRPQARREGPVEEPAAEGGSGGLIDLRG